MLSAFQDNTDNEVNIGYINHAVTVDVGHVKPNGFTGEDDADDDIDVGNVHHSVIIHVTSKVMWHADVGIVTIEGLQGERIVSCRRILVKGELDRLEHHGVSAHVIGTTQGILVKKNLGLLPLFPSFSFVVSGVTLSSSNPQNLSIFS